MSSCLYIVHAGTIFNACERPFFPPKLNNLRVEERLDKSCRHLWQGKYKFIFFFTTYTTAIINIWMSSLEKYTTKLSNWWDEGVGKLMDPNGHRQRDFVQFMISDCDNSRAHHMETSWTPIFMSNFGTIQTWDHLILVGKLIIKPCMSCRPALNANGARSNSQFPSCSFFSRKHRSNLWWAS